MKYIVFDCDGTLIDTLSSNRPLYPGIFDLLTELKESGHLLYVWTARDRISTLRILAENKVLPFFEEISTIDDDLPKPNPAGLTRMLGEIDKRSICVIGDSPTDIIGAKSFGVMSIGALWNNITSSEELEEYSADFLVKDPKVCSKVISDNLKGDQDV
ncbi:MAG TPA: HAD-IA family hydrolase [Bacteriovoracaceae bacterium]|nr:HAD-IA family hydrolase [Bacteriovoracaceae bacterium]